MVRGNRWLHWSGARSAGLGRTKASSWASRASRVLPDGAAGRGARVGREAKGCPAWSAHRSHDDATRSDTGHDDDGGHGPAPHPFIKTERLAHYYK